MTDNVNYKYYGYVRDLGGEKASGKTKYLDMKDVKLNSYYPINLERKSQPSGPSNVERELMKIQNSPPVAGQARASAEKKIENIEKIKRKAMKAEQPAKYEPPRIFSEAENAKVAIDKLYDVSVKRTVPQHLKQKKEAFEPIGYKKLEDSESLPVIKTEK